MTFARSVFLLHAGKGHLVARDVALRVLEIGAELVIGPQSSRRPRKRSSSRPNRRSRRPRRSAGPTTPQRFGPTLLPASFSKAWQAAHRLAKVGALGDVGRRDERRESARLLRLAQRREWRQAGMQRQRGVSALDHSPSDLSGLASCRPAQAGGAETDARCAFDSAGRIGSATPIGRGAARECRPACADRR